MSTGTCCGRWSAVSELEDGTVIAAPIRCNSWQCRFCAARRKRLLLRRLAGSGPQTLMTLTSRVGSHPTPESAFIALSKSVNTLFKRIRRRPGCSHVEYFLVWELTRQGWPHAHLLLRAPFIPQSWLSSTWRELTGAFIVDLRSISTESSAVNYVAKYLSKGPAAPYGFKRYRSSRGWFVNPARTPSTPSPVKRRWHLSSTSTRQLAASYARQRFVCSGDPDYMLTFVPLHVFVAAHFQPPLPA